MNNDLLNYTRLNSSNLDEVLHNFLDITEKLTGSIPFIKNWNDLFFTRLSNTHNCPIKGVTNWDKFGQIHKDKPTYYAGWRCNIEGEWNIEPYQIRENGYKNNISIEAFRLQNGFHTGTFNGGKQFLGQFLFFLDDFPLLKENIFSLKDKSILESVYDMSYLDIKKMITNELRKEKLDTII